MKTAHLSIFLAAMMATAAFAQSWSWQQEDRLINPSGVQIHQNVRVAAGDIDADGWPDVMILDSEGVRFYRNLAMPSGLQFEERPDWALDVDVAGYPPFYKPALVDLDGDRRAEVILPIPRQGTPVFQGYRLDPNRGEWRNADTLVTGLPGGNFISFVDFDRDGDPDAVVAGRQGYRYVENLGSAQRPQWASSPRPVLIPYYNFNPSSVQFTHLNSDSLPDMIAVWDWDYGNALIALGKAEPVQDTLRFTFDRSSVFVDDAWFHTNTALADFNRDGLPELLLAHEYAPIRGFVVRPHMQDEPLQPAFYLTFPAGYRETDVDFMPDGGLFGVQVHWARPTDIPSPTIYYRMFRLEQGVLRFQQPFKMALYDNVLYHRPTISVFDWDGDGSPELAVSAELLDRDGNTMATSLTLIRKNQYGIYVDWPEFFSPLVPDSFYLDPVFRDVNADGRLDLLLQQRGRYAWYENTGTLAEPNWQKRGAWSDGFAADPFYRAAVGDLDRDGRADIVFIKDSLNLVCYRNLGTAAEPQWQADAAVFQNLTLPAPVVNLALADLDDDGDADLILSDRQGRFTAYRNDVVTGVPNSKPVAGAALIRDFLIESQPGAWRIRFRLSATATVRLRIFDLLGRQVGGVPRKILPPGAHRLRYAFQHLASGVYFIHLDAGRQSRARKVVLVR